MSMPKANLLNKIIAINRDTQNSTKLSICIIISLIWWVNEILSIKVHENVTEIQGPPFTIDANPMPHQTLVLPTAIAATEVIGKVITPKTQKPTQESRISTENHVQTQILVADNQKVRSFGNMAVKHNVGIVQSLDNHKPARNDMKDENKQRSNQQKWQIPSPISPLSTSDPKETNSSKRQIGFNGAYDLNAFTPSQEVGSFDQSQGFVPHAFQTPKGIQFPQTIYGAPKPIKHDANYGGGYHIASRLPASAQKNMQAFENDFEDLKTKYPELNELVNNYPIMEELMKQKLAEKFGESDLGLRYHPHISIVNSQESSGEKSKINDQTKAFVNKFAHSSEEAQKSREEGLKHPYVFDFQKANWFGKKPEGDQEVIPTSVTPYDIPAGEIYQDSKLPLQGFPADYDKKVLSGELKHPYYVATKPKKTGVNPWKRLLHMVTAFLPVGILITALTPNIVNINNTADKSYPGRQRSTDWQAPGGAFLELLRDPALQALARGERGCDERDLCLLALKGKEEVASNVEKLLWRLANDAPANLVERVGLKVLFKAARDGDCAQLQCKKYYKTYDTELTEAPLLHQLQAAHLIGKSDEGKLEVDPRNAADDGDIRNATTMRRHSRIVS